MTRPNRAKAHFRESEAISIGLACFRFINTENLFSLTYIGRNCPDHSAKTVMYHKLHEYSSFTKQKRRYISSSLKKCILTV